MQEYIVDTISGAEFCHTNFGMPILNYSKHNAGFGLVEWQGPVFIFYVYIFVHVFI